MKFSKQIVVFRHCTLALKHLNKNSWLIVSVGCECLPLFRGDGRIAFDKLGHDAASGFETHRQRRHVEKQKILHLRRTFTSQNGRLDCCTERYCFIRINGLVGLLTVEELLNHCLDLWNACRTSNKDDLVHVTLVDSTVAHALFDWAHGVAEVIHAQFFKTST